jgi:hypothetical protein
LGVGNPFIFTTSLTFFPSPPAFAALRRGSLFWSRVEAQRRRKARTNRRQVSVRRKIVRPIPSPDIPKTRGQLDQNFNAPFTEMTPDEIINLSERTKIYGEAAAMQWIIQQHPPSNP